MAVLVLGPLLRYIGETDATIWVEADRPCRVEVLGHAVQTFEVAGHHYALVTVTGLRPGSEHAYQVTLDGIVRWPVPDPASGRACCDPWTRAARAGWHSARAGS